MLCLKNTLQMNSSLIGTISLPSIVKWIKKNLDIARLRYHGYSNEILPALSLCYMEIPLYFKNNGKTVCKFLNTVMPKTLQGYLKRAFYKLDSYHYTPHFFFPFSLFAGCGREEQLDDIHA